jgi:hypothetical protein
MEQNTVDQIIAESDNVIAFPSPNRPEPKFYASGFWWTASEWAEYEAYVAEQFG